MIIIVINIIMIIRGLLLLLLVVGNCITVIPFAITERLVGREGSVVALSGGEAGMTMGGIAPSSPAGASGDGGGGVGGGRRRDMMGLDRFTEDQ